MSAKKSDFGLIIKLLVALAIGAFLGRMANVEVMDAVASVKYASSRRPSPAWDRTPARCC